MFFILYVIAQVYDVQNKSESNVLNMSLLKLASMNMNYALNSFRVPQLFDKNELGRIILRMGN